MSTPHLQTGNLFSSRHFNLQQLAEGVYAAINAEGGWSISNAGIIDLGDRTIIFDALLAVEAATDLREAAEQLTGHKVHAVINSHAHYDHTWGNQAFSRDVDIISSTRTREIMATEGYDEIKGFSEDAPKRLEFFSEQISQATDEITRKGLRFYITYYQAILATLAKLQFRLPNVTFEKEMVFYGSKRSARLISYERAHSGNDALLYLPEDGIIFMQDVLFIDTHPYLAGGDPDMIQHILADVRLLRPSIVVPGHGPVGIPEHLDLLDNYIKRSKAIVQEAIRQGLSEDELGNIQIPREYEHFVFPAFFPTNLKFLFHKILGK